MTSYKLWATALLVGAAVSQHAVAFTSIEDFALQDFDVEGPAAQHAAQASLSHHTLTSNTKYADPASYSDSRFARDYLQLTGTYALSEDINFSLTMPWRWRMYGSADYSAGGYNNRFEFHEGSVSAGSGLSASARLIGRRAAPGFSLVGKLSVDYSEEGDSSTVYTVNVRPMYRFNPIWLLGSELSYVKPDGGDTSSRIGSVFAQWHPVPAVALTSSLSRWWVAGDGADDLSVTTFEVKAAYDWSRHVSVFATVGASKYSSNLTSTSPDYPTKSDISGRNLSMGLRYAF